MNNLIILASIALFSFLVPFAQAGFQDIQGQGQQGPLNLQGPTNATGLIGPTGFLYVVIGPDVFLGSGFQRQISEVSCDAGDIVIEGGYHFTQFSTNSKPAIGIVDGPTPYLFPPNTTQAFDNGYITDMFGENSNFGFQTYAYCLDIPPFRP